MAQGYIRGARGHFQGKKLSLPRKAQHYAAKKEAVMTKKWGYWTFYSSNWTLRFKRTDPLCHFDYEIDLETVTSSAKMLDWLLQIKGKYIITSQDVTDLLEAFRYLFDPQCYLCSFGEDKRINNIPAHIRKVLKWKSGTQSASRGKIVQS